MYARGYDKRIKIKKLIMKVYNRLTNKFEEFDNQEFYLTVLVDEERSDKAEIVTLVDTLNTEETPLALNSERDEDNLKAVELFKAEDKNFAKYLDFFVLDNPNSLETILNS